MTKYLLFLCLPLLLAADKTPVRQGQDLALFIAIDDYEEWQDLRNPVSDVRAVAQELAENYGFTTEVMTNPTRSEIYAKLEEYRQRTYGEDDQLLIFFSGHGDFNDGTSEGFFVPREGLLNDPFQDSYIPHTRLERIIDNIPCEHVLLAIDACFSGTFDESIALQRGRPGERPGANTQEDERQWFITRQLKHRSRLYLTSGGKERTPDGDRYSPFTGRLLEALRSYGIDDGILTFAELTGFMQRVEPLPRFGQYGSHEPGGDFLFVSNSVPTRPPVQPGEKDESEKPVVSIGGPNPSAQLSASSSGKVVQRTLEAEKSGKTYGVLQLDNLLWLAENLAEPIEGKTSPGHVIAPVYDNNPQFYKSYGYLYRWDYANSACGLLGKGWRLPTVAEWEALLTQLAADEGLGSYQTAGRFFQEAPLGIQLGGSVKYSSSFSQMGQYGHYLTANVDRASDPYIVQFDNRGQVSLQTPSKGNTPGFSCRCVKDL